MVLTLRYMVCVCVFNCMVILSLDQHSFFFLVLSCLRVQASETRSQSFSFGSTSCPMNSAGESSVSSTPSSSDSSSGRSEASDGGEGEGMDSVSHSADTDDSKLEYTSG